MRLSQEVRHLLSFHPRRFDALPELYLGASMDHQSALCRNTIENLLQYLSGIANSWLKGMFHQNPRQRMLFELASESFKLTRTAIRSTPSQKLEAWHPLLQQTRVKHETSSVSLERARHVMKSCCCWKHSEPATVKTKTEKIF